ncbi:MAG TPA: hypothetical protein VMZ11_04905 [Mycobacteriales bacterium]|nr:hypothetical protein [Mycobacteriales bacterium]
MTRSPLGIAALVCAAAVTAGCGTTVPVTSTMQVGAGGSGQQPLAGLAPDGVTAPGVGSSSSGTGSGAGPAVAGPAASGGTTVTRPGAGAITTLAAIPPKGPGWDQRYVYMGALTVNDLHTVAGGLGINLDPGDLEADANAVATYVNEHGGILGRKLKILFRDMKTLDVASNTESTASAACTDFTQDRRVIALYNPVTTIDTANFRACFARAHTPIFSASSAMLDSQAVKGLEGAFYQTAMVAWDKLAPVFVQRLKAQGWFGGWDTRLGRPSASKPPKVGILTSTTDAGTRVAAEIKGALAAAGYRDSLVFQWTDASAGQNSSVNYFNGNGVTHVIVADLELTAFQNSAQSQQYKPRYGITSYNDPYTNLESLSPKGANNGALGIGWAPAYDVSDANDPGSTGPGEKRCMALQEKAGQRFSGKRTARLYALAACDSILLAVQGAVAAHGLDAGSIYRGALRVSPAFSTAVSFGNSSLTPTHLFTPSSARDLAWFADCECFKYTSKGTTATF